MGLALASALAFCPPVPGSDLDDDDGPDGEGPGGACPGPWPGAGTIALACLGGALAGAVLGFALGRVGIGGGP